MIWEYVQPVQIVFGNGKIREIKKYTQEMKNPLLIAGPFFSKSILAQELRKECGICEVFDKISPNPDVEEVNACSELIREKKIDGIIALGGGSTLDLAKAASVALPSIEEYHWGGKKIPKEHIPVIAVPTTAGTGSEVTSVSVLTDRKRGRKAPIVSDSFYPKIALIDPELTRSLSPYLTAVSGIDVLCHAVEGYWSKGHQPICDALAVHSIKNVLKYLPIAYKQPEHGLAREKMAEASVIAGMAFTIPKTTSSHACSFWLTNKYDIPHGEACGLTLDHFARINGEEPHTRQLAEELGFESVDALADRIAALKEELQLRRDLKDFKLTGEQIAELVKESRHPNMLNNPVFITDDILFELYRKLA